MRLQVRLSPPADGEGEGDLVDATYVNENTVLFTAPFRNVPYVADAAEAGVEISARLVADGVDFTDRAASFEYLPGLSVTAVQPNTGPVRGGTPAMVLGEGFDPAFVYSCRFRNGKGSQPLETVASVVNASALSCQVPPHPLYTEGDASKFPGGSVTVEVARATDGAVSTLGPSFFYLIDVQLDSIYPTTVPARGGIQVRLTGKNFPRTDALLCKFGVADTIGAESGTSSEAVLVQGVWHSTTELDCEVPHLPPGLREVAVTSNGVDWTGGVYLSFEPDRTIVGMTPLAGPPEGGTLVSVTGTGFRPVGSDSPVFDPTRLLSPFCRFGTVEVSAVVVSDDEIACRSPAFNGDNEGPVNVSVAMRYPYTKRRVDFEMSTGLLFTYQVMPTVAGLEPKTAPASGGTELDLTGTGFQDSAALVVRFLDLGSGLSVSATPTFVSPTALFVVIPPSPSGLGGGFVAVEVSNNGQDFSADEVLLFYDEAVGVASVAPATIPETGGTVLTVSGTNFVQSFPSVLACRIGGETVAPATWISSTRLQCYAPPMVVGAPGARHVSVEVTINGVDYTTDAVTVEYRPAISLLSLEPSTGPRRGSTSVTITGTGFRATDSGLVCRFAGTKVAATVLSETAVTCPAPALALGATRRVPVEVAVDGEADTTRSVEFLVDRHAEYGFTGLVFEYYPDEDVSQLSPKSGPITGGTVVRVKGANFLDTPYLSCQFTSQAAANATHDAALVLAAQADADPWSVVVPALYDGPSDLRCVAPPQTVAGGEVTQVAVANNGLDFHSPLGVAFVYAPPVELLSLTPVAGPDEGNTTVTVQGDHFVPSADLACRFGGDLGSTSPARFVSTTTITCVSPPGQATGVVTVAVTTNGVDFTPVDESLHFDYRSSASVYSVFPASGFVGGGSRVTVTGSNFKEIATGDGGTHCRFGAVSVPAELVTSEELVCVAPPHAQGIVSLEVTNNQVARAENGSAAAAWTTAAAAGTQWTDDGLTFRFTPEARVHTVSPSAGSVSGGTVLRVMGSDFLDSAPALTCRFSSSSMGSDGGGGGNPWSADVPATYISPVAVECTTPAYQLANPVDLETNLVGVAVSVNGQDFTSDPVQFQYRAEPAVHAVAPVRGLASGGTVLTVTGENFVDAGSDLLCRFHGSDYNDTTVVGRFLSDTQVACVAPAGPASPEVQRVRVTGTTAGSEVQVVEAYALPAAHEVQSVTTQGWGWQHEIQQLDVQIEVDETEMEVQTLSTMLTHAREVQTITLTGATNVSEVQTLGLSADATGTFFLEYGFYRTRELNHNASAEAVATALAGVEALGDEFQVSRSGDGTTEPYRWRITFVSDVGDVSQLVVNATGLSSPSGLVVTSDETVPGVACEVQSVATAGARGGDFTLSFGGDQTRRIDYDASAEEVEAALESLATLGDVDVALISPNSYGSGRTWMVTFLGNGGDLTLLSFDDADLVGATGGEVAHVTVDEVTKGRSVDISGNWQLGYGSYSVDLPHEATEAQVETALAAANTGLNGGVEVTRLSYTFTGGSVWQVTFRSTVGSARLRARRPCPLPAS